MALIIPIHINSPIGLEVDMDVNPRTSPHTDRHCDIKNLVSLNIRETAQSVH